jgi:DNA modification methylase
MLTARIEDALDSTHFAKVRGKVNLILTSPPFPLVRKKRYGNETGDAYLQWLTALAPNLADLLSPDGSIVIEIGNAWEQGAPVMSTLPLESLLAFKKAANPARLPSPAAWVSIERIRLKDSYTHVWWMSRAEFPKADNRNVLTPYSKEMRKLLRTKQYNAGKRPSGHVISASGFLRNHGGAIAANVLDLTPSDPKLPTSLLKFAGTGWDAKYRGYCQDRDIELHPARMQVDLAAFFIQFLTDKRDLIIDPFAGSNTTGAVAEELGRRWIGVEAKAEYAEGSKGRFEQFRNQHSRADDLPLKLKGGSRGR